MSQSRFSIVLVGVSALLRRPLVSRLRSADGERSPWVVFAARRCLPFRRLPLGGLVLPLGGWPSGSLLPLFGTHRFGVAARRVGLRAHGFRFSARTDPHRRAADARADGAHRHDTCFTSKHLSQHVNLPHRSPQALQNRQTPLLSPTRHPRGRRPHAHHRAHREEMHPGFGRREGRGRRTRGRDHRQSPTGTQRATRRPGLFPSHPPLLGGRGLARTGGRGADQAGARGVPPLVAHSPRPLREGSRRELRAARQKEARRQRATGRFAHGWRYAGSTRAFDGFLGCGLGCDASGYARACASLDGHAFGYPRACRAFAHDVDHHGHARTLDGLLGRRFGCDASGHACACASLDGNTRGYACACRAFAHDVDHHGYARAFDGNAGRRGSLMLAHGATPCRRPLRHTAFRLAPHPAERDSAGHCLSNSLRCARAAASVAVGVGHGLYNSLRCARAAVSVGCRGGARCHEMLRSKGSLGPMSKVISRHKAINRCRRMK